MKSLFKDAKVKQLLTISVALIAGLGIGYLLFHSSTASPDAPKDDHVHLSSVDTWTCSMHPQIRQSEPGDCPICGMELIPLEGNASFDPTVLEMTPEAVKLANIETMIIGPTGKAEKSLTLSGKIQTDERRIASQVVHIPGRIEQLYVSFIGEQIRKGQKIASIYSPELILAQQELLQALKLKTSNPALLEAARKKLEYWKISPEQIQHVEKSGEIQETFDVLADASGAVTSRKVAVGDHLLQGEILFEVVDLGRLWVLFDAYEADLAHVKVGDFVQFTTPAMPDRSFRTRINFIDPLIDPQTRVASLRGEISNRGGLFKPEMFVQGKLQSSVSGNEQLLVPRSAVLWTGKRSVVYVKVPNSSIPGFQYREVQLGERVGEDYLVEEGLRAGEEVVRYGSFAIDAAAQLNNQQSMMNQWVEGEKRGTPTPDHQYQSATPAAFQQQLGELSEAYLRLKDALVATDSTAAGEYIQIFRTQLGTIDMSLLKGKAHSFWMEQLSALETHSQKIASSSDIEVQRKQFSFLSTALIQSIAAFGITGDPLYVQHCPMAQNDDGADWLSAEKEIRNPYFGDFMLTCGYVSDTLRLRHPPSNNHSSHQ